MRESRSPAVAARQRVALHVSGDPDADLVFGFMVCVRCRVQAVEVSFALVFAFGCSWLLYGSLPQFNEPVPCKARFSISSVQTHSRRFSEICCIEEPCISKDIRFPAR